MHAAGLKMPEAYDGKCNNRNKNPCECGAPVLPGVFSDFLCAVSDRWIIGHGRWNHCEVKAIEDAMRHFQMI